MKIIKKINDCFVALALTTFVCIGPTVMPAFAAAIEDPDQTEEPLVSTQEAVEPGSTTSTGNDAALEGTPVEEQSEPIADEATADEAPADESLIDEAAADKTKVDEKDAQAEVASAKDASGQIIAAAETVAPNTFDVSTTDELKAAFEKADSGAAGAYTVNLTADITIGDSLTVSSGRTIDLAGNGHTLTLSGNATLGTKGGALNLNGGLTITAAGAHSSALITVVGGTLNMNDGVTITGNSSNSDGGGVYMTNKATFNMNGGAIENCQAHQGGGVYMDKNTKLTMNGSATIRNNMATNVGGGVYVNTRATFTMEGNASIVQNTADAAGGVMNYGLATLTTVYNNTTRNGAADIFNTGRMRLSPTNPDWVLASTGTHVTGWYIDNYSSTDETGMQSGGNHRWAPGDEDSVEYTPSAGETREVLYLVAGAPLPEEPRINVIWENLDGTILYTMSDVKESEVPAADEYNELSGNADPTEPNAGNVRYVFDNWEEYEDSQGDIIYKAEYHALPDNAPVVPDEQADVVEPNVPGDVPSDNPGDDPTNNPNDNPADVPGDNPADVPDNDPADVPSTHDDPSTNPVTDNSGDNGDATEIENEVDAPDDEPNSDGNDDEVDTDTPTVPETNDTGMALNLAATGGMVAGLAGIAYINRRRNEEDL